MGQQPHKTAIEPGLSRQTSAFAEALSHAVLLIDPEGRLKYANRAAHSLLNIDESVQGEDLYSKLGISPEDIYAIHKVGNSLPDSESFPKSIKTAVVSKLSKVVGVDAKISLLPEGFEGQWMVMVQLETDKIISVPTLESNRRKTAARDAYVQRSQRLPATLGDAHEQILLLEKEMNRWKFATEGNNTGIWEWNTVNNQLNFSSICSQHLGFTRDIDVQKPEDWEQYIFPEDLPRVHAIWQSLVAGKTEHYSTEYRVRHARGNYIWIHDRGRTVEKTPEGRAFLIQGTHEEVHEKVLQRNALSAIANKLKGENQLLANDNDALSVSNKSLANYAYVASHDLQAPLRKIHQFIDLFSTKYRPLVDETGQKYISTIQRTADQMRVLIDDLLAYSRLQVDKDDVEMVDLNHIVTGLMDDFTSQYSDLEIELEGILPIIEANKSQMFQLFQNLIGNGIKYNRNEKKLIKIDAKSGESGVVIKVTDNGIGIAKEDQDRIFDLFVRLHGKNEFSGSGMGLAITKRVIDNINGSISVESEPGKGSSFYILFPVSVVRNIGFAKQ